jgi:hypothetical protein
MICDFCSSSDVVASLKTRSFTVEYLGWNSIGDFIACPECLALVVEGKRGDLLARAVATFLAVSVGEGKPVSSSEFDLVAEPIGVLHVKFFENWTGAIETFSKVQA